MLKVEKIYLLTNNLIDMTNSPNKRSNEKLPPISNIYDAYGSIKNDKSSILGMLPKESLPISNIHDAYGSIKNDKGSTLGVMTQFLAPLLQNQNASSEKKPSENKLMTNLPNPFSCSNMCARAMGGAIGVLTTQPLSLPFQNMGALRVAKGEPYIKLMQDVIKKDGFTGLYKNAKNNTIRRMLVTALPMAMATILKEQYKFNPMETTLMCAILETGITLLRGEMLEKHLMTRSKRKEMFEKNKPLIAGFISIRNLMASTAAFYSKTLAKKLVETPQFKTIQEKIGTKDANAETTVNLLLKVFISYATTPIDCVATRLAYGMSIQNILSKNLTPLFKGALTRTAFSTLSVSIIPYCIEKFSSIEKNASENHSNLTSEQLKRYAEQEKLANDLLILENNIFSSDQSQYRLEECGVEKSVDEVEKGVCKIFPSPEIKRILESKKSRANFSDIAALLKIDSESKDKPQADKVDNKINAGMSRSI